MSWVKFLLLCSLLTRGGDLAAWAKSTRSWETGPGSRAPLMQKLMTKGNSMPSQTGGQCRAQLFSFPGDLGSLWAKASVALCPCRLLSGMDACSALLFSFLPGQHLFLREVDSWTPRPGQIPVSHIIPCSWPVPSGPWLAVLDYLWHPQYLVLQRDWCV